MSIREKSFRALLSPINWLCCSWGRFGAHFHGNLKAPVHHVKTRYGDIKLMADSPVLSWRAKNFHSKEPETLSWIDQIPVDSTFYDIGANVGLYSLYASKKGLSVYSFEPESLNYAELNKNIYLNGLSESIHAFNVGLCDKTSFDRLNLSIFCKGWSMHTASKEKDFEHKPFAPAYRQGLFVATLDDLVSKYNVPCPDYIKVDVDGLEPEIIKGARHVLGSGKVKGLLIELNEGCQDDMNIVEEMKCFGFKLQSKTRCDPSERFRSLYNYIFSRIDR